MCGIVGYIGRKKAAPVLLKGLSYLEYRGYDSAGLAVITPKGAIEIAKEKGRLSALVDKTDGGNAIEGFCGVGHTRWATHGKPDETNAHPHTALGGKVAAVHNGIIENYSELKEMLSHLGCTFYSQTDTEVAVKLVGYYYEKCGDPIKALSLFAQRARGSFALAVLFADRPNEIFAIRKDSPMIVGAANGESFLASDVTALLQYTKQVYYVGNLQIARLTAGDVKFFDLEGKETEVPLTTVEWDIKAAEKGGYEHFMLKEIHEQPAVIRDTLGYALHNGDIDLAESKLTDDVLKKISRIYFVGCGSAYHVGVAAQYVVEDLTKVPVRVELASELRYRTPLLTPEDFVVIVSQSGETADSLAALKLAKSRGAKTFAIVNVVGSAIAREADYVFYIKAGPEISVATTKAYSTQLVAVYLFAIRLAKVLNRIDDKEYRRLIEELQTLPEKVEAEIERKDEVRKFAEQLVHQKDVFFVGRGLDYAVCMEGSLKLKEISYIHSEAYAAGELKHGTISLIEEGILVLGVLTQKEVAEKTASNLEETKSRGAYIAAVGSDSCLPVKASEKEFHISKIDEHFAASLAVIPLQLFAYYLSVLRGNDVDNPRNLAKSVTVE